MAAAMAMTVRGVTGLRNPRETNTFSAMRMTERMMSEAMRSQKL